MKKIFVTLLIFVALISQVSAKEKDFEKKNDFSKLDRYVQTFEYNDPEPENEYNEKDTDKAAFELKAIEELKERYETNAIELKINEPDEEAISKINSERLFKIRINENQYKIENSIKNENMIWDNSKQFKLSNMYKKKNIAPIPSIVNSSKLNYDSLTGLSASFGQVSLHDSIGTSVLFLKENESAYNTGAVMSYKGKRLNASTGSFLSSYNNAASGGLILSTEAFNSPILGSFSLGSAIGAKEYTDGNKATGGLFGEYTYKRLKINAQISSSEYSYKQNNETGLYLIPELKLTNSLSLKTRLSKNVTQNTLQDELVLSYSPQRSKNNLSLELNASNYGGEKTLQRRRIKFSASFKI